jgi:hypothetical protein
MNTGPQIMDGNRSRVLIGMYHNRKSPTKVSRAYLYSAIAKNEGADFFYFVSRHVDFDRQKVLGTNYENGAWIEREYDFPDVIINAANFETPFQKLVSERLKRLIPFTSYPVGSKKTVFRKLQSSPLLREYIIPYQGLKSADDVFLFLDRYNKIILKPVRGHHGNGLMSLEKDNAHFLLRFEDRIRRFDADQLRDYVSKIRVRMLMQKFIDCKLKSGEPYDFRIHLQKNRDGNWGITTIIPRVGSRARVITNLSQGSQMIDYASFMKNVFEEEEAVMRRKIEVFSMNFVRHFGELYSHGFDELGLDVGIDENRRIWLYEVNWRPGHVFIEVKTGRNAITYAMFLARQRQMEGNSPPHHS